MEIDRAPEEWERLHIETILASISLRLFEFQHSFPLGPTFEASLVHQAALGVFTDILWQPTTGVSLDIFASSKMEVYK
jgi:hypothetical protein